MQNDDLQSSTEFPGSINPTMHWDFWGGFFFFFPVFFFQVFLKAVFGLVLFFKETAHRIILDFYHFTLLYSFLLAI